MAGITRKTPLSVYLLLRILPVAVLILFVIGYLAVERLQVSVARDVEQVLNDDAGIAVASIAERIDAVVAQAQNLAQNDLMVNGLIDTQNRENYLPAFFRSLRITGPGNPRAGLYDYKGRALFVTADHEKAVEAAPDWVDPVMNGETVVSFSVKGLLVAAPVISNGLPEGAVVVDYTLADLEALFTLGNLHIVTAVIDSAGTVLQSSDANFVTVGQLHSAAHSDRWVEFHRAIPGYPGLELVSAQKKEVAYAPVTRTRGFLVGAMALILLVLVGGIVFTAFMATREVSRLSRLIREVGHAEDLSNRVDLRGPAELRDLGASFNAMAEALEQTTTSKDRVDKIFSSLSDLLIVANPAGEIQIMNPAAERFLARRGLDSSSDILVVLGGAVDLDYRTLGGFVATDQPVQRLEAFYETGGMGERIAIAWSRSTLLDAVGRPRGLIVVGQDVSEKYRLDALKSDFISVVSHELRTPLTSIKGSLDLLAGIAGGEKRPENEAKLVDIARRNSDRLLALINDLLDIQKIECGEMVFARAVVDAEEVITAAISLNQGYALEFGVSFALDPDVPKARIDVDIDRFNQIMANLLSNAAKFSPKGGTVAIRLRLDGGALDVSVSDEGPGIPEEFRYRIFEKFAQAEAANTRATGGTGLGLAICKSLVEGMGGEIGFDSAPGKGSTFFVRFPAIVDPPALRAVNGAPA